MKIFSWNIRGCNHPRKIKTLARKIKLEKPDILFLQETKCSFETMMKIRDMERKQDHGNGRRWHERGNGHFMETQRGGSLGVESWSLLPNSGVSNLRIRDQRDDS